MTKLNPHSRLASFYRYFYMTDKLPNNLCNYFWGLLVAILVSPFVWMAMYQNYRKGVIKLRDFDNYEYKKDGNGVEYCDVTIKKRYDVGYSTEKTINGLFYSFVTLAIGLITFGLVNKFGFNIDFTFLKSENLALNIIKVLSFFYFMGLIIGLIVTGIVLAFIGLSRLIPVKPKKVETEEEYWARKDKEENEYRTKKARSEANPSFFVLAWRWLVAIKEKNCPMLTWDYNDTKDNK